MPEYPHDNGPRTVIDLDKIEDTLTKRGVPTHDDDGKPIVSLPLRVNVLADDRDRLREALTEALDWMEHASSMPEAEEIAHRLRQSVAVRSQRP